MKGPGPRRPAADPDQRPASGRDPGAARVMTVHTNTIVYRLNRIKELTGRDPRKPDDIIFLALSLRLAVPV